MSAPGYSGTPLPKKLGIKPGSTCRLINAPSGFDQHLSALEPAIVWGEAPFDVILLFSVERSVLLVSLERSIQDLKKDGGLWICWPKKSAGVPTDLVEDDLRTVILPLGLVDNKVCAVTEVWSGLRFVWRKELR